jgi:hypothetical protein
LAWKGRKEGRIDEKVGVEGGERGKGRRKKGKGRTRGGGKEEEGEIEILNPLLP